MSTFQEITFVCTVTGTYKHLVGKLLRTISVEEAAFGHFFYISTNSQVHQMIPH